jgi:hypothetical protein
VRFEQKVLNKKKLLCSPIVSARPGKLLADNGEMVPVCRIVAPLQSKPSWPFPLSPMPAPEFHQKRSRNPDQAIKNVVRAAYCN